MLYSDANMHQLNWDNLRFVFAVARHHSVAAAARELGVNRTTVLRRLNSFEESFNCRLFERTASGYVLTPEAEKMIEAAQEVEATLYNLQRQVAGRELQLAGELKVTTTDTFLTTIVGPQLQGFYRKHPNIVIEFTITNSVLDLNRRDADVAIRPTRVPDAHLVGERLGDVKFGIYATRRYLAENPANDMAQHRWIGYDRSLLATPPGQWFSSRVEKAKVCLRCDSFLTVKVACENNLGLALMPSILADNNDNLVAVRLANKWSNIKNLDTGLWLLTHPDLIKSARVHAFIEHFTSTLGSALT